MTDVRTVLAAVLGVGLGLVLLAFPNAVIRVHTAGRRPHDRGGDYGQSEQFPVAWRRLVRVVGAAFVAAGLYFAWTVVGA